MKVCHHAVRISEEVQKLLESTTMLRYTSVPIMKYRTIARFKSLLLHCRLLNVGRDSSVGIVTSCGLDGPGFESRLEARFFASVQTNPVAHPASYTVGTGSFPRVKWPGRGVDYTHPSSAKVKERVELNLRSNSGPSWPVGG